MQNNPLENKIKEIRQNHEFYENMKENKKYRDMFLMIYNSEFPDKKVTDEELITLL